MKQNNKILLRSTNYLRNTIADSAGASVMAGFDYRQYAAELPGRPRTAPIRRKKRMAKDVPYAHLRKRTSRILFGRSNDSISVRQGRRNIMFKVPGSMGRQNSPGTSRADWYNATGLGTIWTHSLRRFKRTGSRKGLGTSGRLLRKRPAR